MDNTLTKTELEIMEYLWEINQEVTATDIRNHFAEKNWSKQAISTFLKQLVIIGYLKRRKVSVTKYYYSVLITKEEHELLPARNIVQNIYGGSYENFVCALVPNKASKNEIDELKQILSDFIERNGGNTSK